MNAKPTPSPYIRLSIAICDELSASRLDEPEQRLI